MKHRLVVLPRAKQSLYESAMWWSENRSAEQALKWMEGFERCLEHLD